MLRLLERFLGRWKRTPPPPSDTPPPSELLRLQSACALTAVQQEIRPAPDIVQPCLRDDALGTKPTAAAKAHAARLIG